MASTIDKGSSDSRENIAIFCGIPSSNIWKSSCFSEATGAPPLSVTVAKTFTNLTLTRKVVEASSVEGTATPAVAGCFASEVPGADGAALVGGAGEVVWAPRGDTRNDTAVRKRSADQRIWAVLCDEHIPAE